MKKQSLIFIFALGLISLQAQGSKCFEVFNRSAIIFGGTADVRFAKAIVYNNLQVAQEALEAGADKDARILVKQFAPKQVAQFMAKNNQKDNELVQHHLSEVLSVMSADSFIEPVTTEITPLVLAHALGHQEIVEFLTKQQAKFAINEAEININQLKTSYGREALKPILANHSKNQRVMVTSFMVSATGTLAFYVFPFMGQAFDYAARSIHPEAVGDMHIMTIFHGVYLLSATMSVVGFFPLLTSLIKSFGLEKKLKEANELKFINGPHKDVKDVEEGQPSLAE